MRATLHALCVVLLGCSSAASPAPTTPAEAEQETGDFQTVEPLATERAFCGLYVVGSYPKPPAEIFEAGAVAEEADALGEQKRWSEAGALYLRVAQTLLIESETHQEAIDTNRRIAYANATLAYLNADKLELARSSLNSAAERDPTLAPALKAAAAELPRSPSCKLETSPQAGSAAGATESKP